MSITYGFEVILNADYNQQNLLILFENMINEGCILYKEYFERIITLNEAVHIILQSPSEFENNFITAKKFETGKFETGVCFNFSENIKSICINLVPLQYLWVKEDGNSHKIYVDIARYTRFFLKLISSLCSKFRLLVFQ